MGRKGRLPPSPTGWPVSPGLTLGQKPRGRLGGRGAIALPLCALVFACIKWKQLYQPPRSVTKTE